MGEIQQSKTSLQIAMQQLLNGDAVDAKNNEDEQLNLDIERLVNTLKGVELIDAVIYRCQIHYVEALGMNVDDDFSKLPPVERYDILSAAHKVLTSNLSFFISDQHRCFIVRHHATGRPTAEAVEELIEEDDIMHRLAQKDAIGYKVLREKLIHGLSYLKPTNPRWSIKKYQAVWSEARHEYTQAMADIPLSSRQEQVALMAKNAKRIDEELDKGGMNYKDYVGLSNELRKTMVSLQKMTPEDDPQTPINLSDPQWVAVIERLTVALEVPDQQIIEGNTAEVVGLLEQLTLALKVPAHQAEGNETKALPPAKDSDDNNTAGEDNDP